MGKALKSCPYCGSNATVKANVAESSWVISCNQCSAMMSGTREENPRFQYMDQRDDLIREWNKRHEQSGNHDG